MAELRGDAERELAKAADMAGLSQEFAALIAERDELAQQRGALAARVVELQSDGRKLARVLQAAVEMTCSDSWDDASEEAKALEQSLRDCGYIVASDSQPSERTE